MVRCGTPAQAIPRLPVPPERRTMLLTLLLEGAGFAMSNQGTEPF
jgi:hypothetical protein